MESFIFFYEQKEQQKVMQIKLPIGTQPNVETWQGLFEGFDARLLRVARFSELVR